ncbi:MAG: peptidoglycan DD-metalloendopeptidase family protein [Actinobacteria bacterium]|nr:peptidoglycan DD-metalloendopeptidase family protein [Actinomycetota bacterium]
MMKLGAALVALIVAVVAGVVVLGSRLDRCEPILPVSDISGLDVPAEPVPTTTSAPFTARIATWNTLHTNSTRRIAAGVAAISESADVIGLQEFNPPSRRATIARAMAKRGWGMTDSNNSVQILYNATKYKVLAQDAVKVIGVVRIEGGTAGTSIGPKSLVWVQLQDRSTGGVFFVLNMHIVPDIDRKGHRRPNAPKRLAVRDKQRATALSVIAKLRKYGPVAWTEDSNVDNRRDQKNQDPDFDFDQMKRAGMMSNWSVLGLPSYGTQSSGRRLIDKVNLTMENGRFLAQQRLGRWGSDHHAVVATIALRGARSTAPVNATSVAPSTALPASLTVPGWQLDADQIKVAATAIEVGKQLGIPERGWIVAIAAALTESDMRNIDYGDRDSVGPWQMRPSTGWGTVAQIRDLTLGARAFYGLAEHTSNPGLLDIKGWEQMTIGQAAQAVERSAFPGRYAPNEAAARAVVAKLAPIISGDGAAAAADDGCPTNTVPSGDVGNCPATNLPAEAGLKRDALLVLRCIRQQFPAITDIGGVRRDRLPDHPSGRAVDLMIPNYQTSSGKEFGWQVARWLQTHQRQLGVEYLIFDNRIWSVKRDSEGWRVYRPSGQGSDSSLHYNHVHVTVFGESAKPDGPIDSAATGPWRAPISASFPAGCGFRGAGCKTSYASHTGQDFPAPAGTPVYAVANGTVTRSESILPGRRRCTTLPICGSQRVSYGNLIVIQTAGEGEVTAWYAHLTERRVRVGESVRAGQVIGTVGWQGNVIPRGPGGSHLHFEIRRQGTPVNPMPYLRTKGIHL